MPLPAGRVYEMIYKCASAVDCVEGVGETGAAPVVFCEWSSERLMLQAVATVYVCCLFCSTPLVGLLGMERRDGWRQRGGWQWRQEGHRVRRLNRKVTPSTCSPIWVRLCTTYRVRDVLGYAVTVSAVYTAL